MDIAQAQRRAVLAGVGGIASAMIVGFPYTFVVLRDNVSNFNAEDKKFAESEKGKGPIELGKKVPGTERAWRMAHMEALTNGFLALLIGALVPSLKLEEKELARLANATAVCVAGNVIGSTVAAAGETRGLMSGGSKMGIVAYWNFMAAVAAAPVALYYLAKGISKI